VIRQAFQLYSATLFRRIHTALKQAGNSAMDIGLEQLFVV
jgi:hypothetical protein